LVIGLSGKLDRKG